MKKTIELLERWPRVVAVDVETTGLSVRHGGRVIEVGLVAMEDGFVTAEFDTLIDCGVAVSPASYRVHGISDTMLAGHPLPEEIWPRVREFMDGALIVAHNAPFDSGFVRRELAMVGLTLPNPWHCTARLARKVLPFLNNHRLLTVYQHFFGELPCAIRLHRALDDARLAARVWEKLVQEVVPSGRADANPPRPCLETVR